MYINPRSKPLAHLDRLQAWKAGHRPAPVTVEWDLSNACSLGCAWCHFAHTHEKGPLVGSPRHASYDSTGLYADPVVVRRGLTSMRALGVQGLVWSGGGEPTLHPQFFDLVRYAEALDFSQGLYTHGGHLTAESARYLGETLTWVVVSLDTHEADTYAREKRVPRSRFTAACDGITMLAHRQTILGVSFLLTEHNWKDIVEMLRLSRSLGATYTTFRPAVLTDPKQPGQITTDRSWIDEASITLTALAKEPDVELDVRRFRDYQRWTSHGYTTCYGIRLTTTVTPDGRVWVCPNRRGMLGSVLGDLREESFADIWARHPGQWTDFQDCRAMCRLHPVNQTLASVYASREHEAFI